MHLEYLMGYKGAGGGNEGSKHWKTFRAAKAVAPVLFSDDALSRLGGFGWRGVARVDTTRSRQPKVMVDIAWAEMGGC